MNLLIHCSNFPFSEDERPSSHGSHNWKEKRGWVGCKQFVGEINSSIVESAAQKRARANAFLDPKA